MVGSDVTCIFLRAWVPYQRKNKVLGSDLTSKFGKSVSYD